MLNLVVLMFALLSFINPPEPDPECVSPWTPVWTFENSPYCDGGHYELWSCRIPKYSEFRGEWYYTLKLESTCGVIGDPITEEMVNTIFLPLIWR